MKQLTAQIAAAYSGCEIIHTNVSGYGKRLLPKGIYEESYIEGCYLKILNTAEHNVFFLPMNQCQLILTPLSEITDEHAIEVGKIFGFKVQLLENGKWLAKNLHNSKFDITTIKQMQVIDYLRSMGYDCGYGDISSLIEAGIAIPNTQTTTP